MEWTGHHALIAEFIRRMSPFDSPVLDVGGYDGPYASLFPRPYYILDSSVTHITTDGIINLEGWVTDGVLDGLFSGARFKTVVCTEALEHFDDPIRAFGNMAAHLDTGGKLLVTSPSAWGYHASPKDYWRLQTDAWFYLANKSGIDVAAYEAPVVGEGAICGFFCGIKR